MLILDEIHVRGAKLVYDHFWVENVHVNILKHDPRVLEEGPKLVPQIAKDSPTNSWQPTSCGSVDALLEEDHRVGVSIGRGEFKYKPQSPTTDQHDGLLVKRRVDGTSACEAVLYATSLLSEG